MTFPTLSKGALREIYHGNEQVEKPICQVLGTSKLRTSDRYRVLVSDGAYINPYTMLAIELESIIEDGTLAKFSIIQIERYTISPLNESENLRYIMTISEVTQKAKGSDVGRKIGNPVPVEKPMGSENAGGETSRAHPSSTASNTGPKRPAEVAVQIVPKKQGLNNPMKVDLAIPTVSIIDLNPSMKRWVVKARVSNKTEIRSWSNDSRKGQLFSFDIIDGSGEIRCTGFNEAIDKYFNLIEIGKIYYISGCQMREANRTYNNLKHHYEMTVNCNAEIIPSEDSADDKIPVINFDFRPINTIENCNRGDIIDVLGIVKQISPLRVITSSDNSKQYRKREVALVDKSQAMVALTLWEGQAETFDVKDNSVVAVRGAKVGEYDGKSFIGMISSTAIKIDPDHPDAHALREWWNSGGKTMEIIDVSKGIDSTIMDGNWKDLKDAIRVGRTLMEEAEVYKCKATITSFCSDNAVYKACPIDSCHSKVFDHEGSFRCEKCDREYPNFKYRIQAHMNLSDMTGNIWATAFTTEAESLLGMTAQEFGELADENRKAYLAKCSSLNYASHFFKIRMKMENYHDGMKLKSVIEKVAPINWEHYNHFLQNKLKERNNFPPPDKTK